MRGHEEPEKENGERWLLTYSDLITLLLALFIILFSMSNVDKEKYAALIESLGSVFGAVQGTAAPGNGAGGEINFPIFTPGTSIPPSNPPGSSELNSPGPSPGASSSPGNGGAGNAIDIEAQAMENVKNLIVGLLDDENLQNDVTVSIRPRGLVISINSRVLFASGSASLTSESRDLVRRIASILTPLAKNKIQVEGHTDTDPISTAQFPSNWHLSSARASTVLCMLLENNKNLIQKNITAQGCGEYYPVAPNDTPANKAKNRRVVIYILKDEYSKTIDIAPDTH